MKNNVIVKIFLDITMIILYLLLMFANGLGGFFHETVGLGVGVLFIVHIVLNITMIKGFFVSVKNKNIKPYKAILLIADILLAISMPIVIVTGALIAKELFVVNSGISWLLLYNVHNILSYVCLGIMALHILLHAKYLVGVFKMLPSALSEKEMKSAVCRFSAGAVVAVILYTSIAVFKNIADNKNVIEIHEPEEKEVIVTTIPTETSVIEDIPITSITEVTDETTIEKTAPTTEETTVEITTTAETTSVPPTLEEYLSKLTCTGCGKRCSLLRPRCGKGHMQAEYATEEYYSIYGE
ncbi:MAG: DUF4405 domain-containing protein [Oscillospiraceae bacterium]